MHAFIACMVSAMATRPSQTKQARAPPPPDPAGGAARLRGLGQAPVVHLGGRRAGADPILDQPPGRRDGEPGRQGAVRAQDAGPGVDRRRPAATHGGRAGAGRHRPLRRRDSGPGQPPRIALDHVCVVCIRCGWARGWPCFQRQYPEIEIRVDASDRAGHNRAGARPGDPALPAIAARRRRARHPAVRGVRDAALARNCSSVPTACASRPMLGCLPPIEIDADAGRGCARGGPAGRKPWQQPASVGADLRFRRPGDAAPPCAARAW